MVALDKQFFRHHGSKPRSRGRWRDESWQAGKTPGRRAADILSARRHRDTSNSSNTSCANEIIYCGYRFDTDTKLSYVRNRTYNPVLGRWIQRDPIGYDGGINLYQVVGSGPVENVDPSGLGRQGNYPSPPYPGPNWGHGYGDLIYNYELLKVKVCPADLANDIKAARQQLGQFSAFNQGNIANVRLNLIRGGIYADFGLDYWSLAIGNYLNGNDNLVRLIYGGQYLEAVTQNNHFLVGIRRWYVMPFSKDSFIVFTQAYERANGWSNWVGNKVIDVESITFQIWDRELINVALFIKGRPGGASWGTPINYWHQTPGATNASGNPWIQTLPPSQRIGLPSTR